VPAAKAAVAPERLTVTAAPIQARAVDRVVETTGSLLAWEEVTVNTAVPGTIARLPVDLGDQVRAGQVVAELETREFTLGVQQADAALRAARDTLARTHAQVDSARASLQQVRDSRKSWEANLKRWQVALEEARLNLERSRKLVEGELVAQRELDAARTLYESVAAQYETAQVDMGQYPERVLVAEAQLRSDLSAVQVAEAEVARRQAELGLAEKRLGDATLRTPIGGAIARRHVNPGEYVKENVAVFSIVRSHPLKYSGVVSEHAALQIRPGQAVKLEVDPVPGRAFTGRVTRVSPAVDVANRTVLLEAEVPNPDGLLKPGLFARGVLATRRDAAVPFVPEAAVSTFAGITKVFVLADGKARETSVKLGLRQDGMVEILEGVRPGQQVATSSLAQLYDGAAVTVQARPKAAP
jgi:RND family efflux transporter MFP subunit